MLFVVTAAGLVFDYASFDSLPPSSVLVNAIDRSDALIKGLSRIRVSKREGVVKGPVAQPTNPPPTQTTHTAAPRPNTPATTDIHSAASQLSNMLESMLDESKGVGKLVRVNREQLAEAFTLADFLSTQTEDDE